jgi:hypothetical protein
MSPRAASAAALCLLAACARDGPAAAPDLAPQPGPGRGRLEAAVTAGEACAACHDDEARSWAGSRHHLAATNGAFAAAFAAEPSAFCQDCHAPESVRPKSPSAAVRALGVGCVTCHVTEEGVVLAAATPRSEERAPHPLRRSPSFAQAGGCAGCHEFRFPGARGDEDGRFMQTTVREHARSATADTPCAGCHMPRIDGLRSHAFDQVRDPAWLRGALDARASRVGPGTARIALGQRRPGHGFPTGDLFRRLQIGVEASDAAGHVTARATRYLARQLVLAPGSPERQLAGDDRVFDEPRVVELSVAPPPPGGRLAFWVTLQRVATAGTGQDPEAAAVESEVLIHRGDVP